VSGRPGDIVIVVIVSFRRPADVLTCLASFTAWGYAAFEVIVVENGGAKAFDELKSRLSETYRADTVTDLSSVADTRHPEEKRGSIRLYSPFGWSTSPINRSWRQFRVCWCRQPGSWLPDQGADLARHFNMNPDTQPEHTALEILVNYCREGRFGLVADDLSILLAGLFRCVEARAGFRSLVAP